MLLLVQMLVQAPSVEQELVLVMEQFVSLMKSFQIFKAVPGGLGRVPSQFLEHEDVPCCDG